MTRHSTLTNADDLHYAKIRTFTGSPVLITPNFVNQLLVSEETNSIYRATSLNQGGLIELVAALPPGGNDSAAASVGSGSPISIPESVGQLYFDVGNLEIYISSRLSAAAWIPLPNHLSFSFIFTNQTAIPNSDIRFSLYYSEEFPTGGFNFENAIASGIAFSSQGNVLNNSLGKKIIGNGLGYYAFGYSTTDEFGLATICSVSISDNSRVSSRLPFLITANNVTIDNVILELTGFPKSDAIITFRVELINV